MGPQEFHSPLRKTVLDNGKPGLQIEHKQLVTLSNLLVKYAEKSLTTGSPVYFGGNHDIRTYGPQHKQLVTLLVKYAEKSLTTGSPVYFGGNHDIRTYGPQHKQLVTLLVKYAEKSLTTGSPVNHYIRT